MPLLLSKALKRRNRQSRPAQLRKKVLKNKGANREEGEAAFAGCNDVVCWSGQSQEEC